LNTPYQDVTLLTEDGLKLSAWYTPPENGAVILVAHGFKGYRSIEMHALFARYGYGVVSWDFRAHGESEGELCTMGYYEALDVEAALDFALEQSGAKRVGAWGGSMDGVAVIEAAAQRSEIDAVAVDSVFPALQDALDQAVSVPALRPIVRFFAEQESGLNVSSLRPVDQIGRISPRPVFIIQGASDDFIPADSIYRLYSAAGEPRILWLGPGVEHTEMHSAFPEEYEQRIKDFFDTSLLGEE
jgi:fermentation-respiration switch protein FrsA (DUF1100 family)